MKKHFLFEFIFYLLFLEIIKE